MGFRASISAFYLLICLVVLGTSLAEASNCRESFEKPRLPELPQASTHFFIEALSFDRNRTPIPTEKLFKLLKYKTGRDRPLVFVSLHRQDTLYGPQKHLLVKFKSIITEEEARSLIWDLLTNPPHRPNKLEIESLKEINQLNIRSVEVELVRSESQMKNFNREVLKSSLEARDIEYFGLELKEDHLLYLLTYGELMPGGYLSLNVKGELLQSKLPPDGDPPIQIRGLTSKTVKSFMEKPGFDVPKPSRSNLLSDREINLQDLPQAQFMTDKRMMLLISVEKAIDTLGWELLFQEMIISEDSSGSIEEFKVHRTLDVINTNTTLRHSELSEFLKSWPDAGLQQSLSLPRVVRAVHKGPLVFNFNAVEGFFFGNYFVNGAVESPRYLQVADRERYLELFDLIQEQKPEFKIQEHLFRLDSRPAE